MAKKKNYRNYWFDLEPLKGGDEDLELSYTIKELLFFCLGVDPYDNEKEAEVKQILMGMRADIDEMIAGNYDFPQREWGEAWNAANRK